MPVHSRTPVLLTRPLAAAERFAKSLPGMEIVIAPLMELVGTGAEIALEGFAGLVLSSEAAVPFLPAAALPAYCVGPRTTEAASAAGFDARDMGPDAAAMVSCLLAAKPKCPLLHVHGRHQRGDVAKRLTEGGLTTLDVVAYDQRAVAPDARFRAALARDGLLIPLFSPRSAALFAQSAQGLTPTAQLLAMSEAVADALPADLRARTTILTAPNGAEMTRALLAAAMRRNSP